MENEKMRYFRKERRLTQKALGELCGIAESTIRRYEAGTLKPKIETVQKIAFALNVSTSDLMGWDEQYPDMKNEVARYEGFLGYLQSLGYTVLDVDAEDGSITLSKDGHTVHFLKTEFQNLETASSDMIAFKFWQMATHSQQNQ